MLELEDSAVTSLLLRRVVPGELLGVVNVDKLGAPGLFLLTFNVTIPLRRFCRPGSYLQQQRLHYVYLSPGAWSSTDQ